MGSVFRRRRDARKALKLARILSELDAEARSTRRTGRRRRETTLSLSRI